MAERMCASCFNIAASILLHQTAGGRRGGRSHGDIQVAHEECCGEAMTCAVQRLICSLQLPRTCLRSFQNCLYVSHVLCRSPQLASLLSFSFSKDLHYDPRIWACFNTQQLQEVMCNIMSNNYSALCRKRNVVAFRGQEPLV
ncbi:hypothetical protein EVAR_52407_1 [Eumeta japonica]|uniref:Uncharacterized protein n=1 Tax=Eumeta variegata TaxID=151549 RepID=A0A4C1Z142_EUMVA|nr:hypothetical protein EVAR_52407_1 [Eumeta japonica]